MNQTKYTKKEFAKICGLNPKTWRSYINTNISRGKIILSPDGFIDISVPLNSEFVEKSLSRRIKPGLDKKELNEALLRQELLKKEAETRLLNLKEEKIRSEIVPFELALKFFEVHRDSEVYVIDLILDPLFNEISRTSSIDPNYLKSEKKKLKAKFIGVIENNYQLSVKRLKSSARELAFKKGVGEHD